MMTLEYLMNVNVLTNTFLKTESDFWRNVQDFSTRVKDNKTLSQLCVIALDKFDNRHIKNAALINLLYRSMEIDIKEIISFQCLEDRLKTSIESTKFNASFSDCRWYLSLCLAGGGWYSHRLQLNKALYTLDKAEKAFSEALTLGQPYTNYIKIIFLRVIITYHINDEQEVFKLRSIIERALKSSHLTPCYYLFENEYAYEEVSYVYTLLRQLYNWHRILCHEKPTYDLELYNKHGFLWQVIGMPFNTIKFHPTSDDNASDIYLQDGNENKKPT